MTTPSKTVRPPAAPRRPYPLVAHGDERVDDWYWLKDRNDPEVLALLEAENEYTAASTRRLEPLLDEIYAELLARVQLSDVTYPAAKGELAYYSRTVDGLAHAIYCRRPATAPPPDPDPSVTDEDETVVLDENALAEGSDYLVVGDRAVSPDRRLLAYAVDTTGGELMTLRVRDIASSEDLDDVVEGVSYGLAWSADSTQLFYTRPDATMRPYQVWRHRLGSRPDEDTKVVEEGDARFFLGVESSKDERLVLVHSASSTTSEWLVIPADAPERAPRVVEPRRHGVLYLVEHHDGELLVLSNDGGVNFALYRAPLSDPGRESWDLVLAERSDVRLDDLDVIAGHVLVSERGHATTAIRVVALDGGSSPANGGERLIEAPPAGSIRLSHNLDFDTELVCYETTTLVEPRRLHSLDLSNGETVVLDVQRVPGGYDPTRYRTEQRWARSADGTEVAVTIAWRADRAAGPGPALLYGYGAYGISCDPNFRTDRSILPLLDRGFAFAIAHVRGGEELGRHWYLDGKLSAKHHSFEDFLAAAHLLVADGWTVPEQLAATGASAGGLLMGATANLDPAGFAAIVAEVPFVDCLTTMLDRSLPLTTNEWEEWGDPINDPAAYEWIKAYSPYDNVEPVRYPLMLVTAGLTDPRVSFFEPLKWTQKLRAAHQDNHVLLKVELSAGHFGPSSRYEAWKRRAFVLAFIVEALSLRAEDGNEGTRAQFDAEEETAPKVSS